MIYGVYVTFVYISLCYQYIMTLKLKGCYLVAWFSALPSAQAEKIDYSGAVLFTGTYLHSMRLQSLSFSSPVLERLFFFCYVNNCKVYVSNK